MTSTYELYESLQQLLVDTFNVLEEVQVVDITSSEDDQPNNVDEVKEQEWDDLDSDAKDDKVKIQNRLSDDDLDSEDNDEVDNKDNEWDFDM